MITIHLVTLVLMLPAVFLAGANAGLFYARRTLAGVQKHAVKKRAETPTWTPACENCGRTHWGSHPAVVKRIGGILRCDPCLSSYRDGQRDYRDDLHDALKRNS